MFGLFECAERFDAFCEQKKRLYLGIYFEFRALAAWVTRSALTAP